MMIERRARDIEAGGVELPARLWVPPSVMGVVIAAQPCGVDGLLAHRGQLLEELCADGYAVLALGLLNPGEECSDELARIRRFDVEGLSKRLVKAIDWLGAEGFAAPIGVLASGTAAAAALIAASRRRIGAIVTIEGRPDLAGKSLFVVPSPTLFLVGADDEPGLAFNQLAADRLKCTHELQTYAATASPDLPSSAAKSAARWFEQHLQVAAVGEFADGAPVGRLLDPCA